MPKVKVPVIPAAYINARMRPLSWSYTQDAKTRDLCELLETFEDAIVEAFRAANARASSFTLTSPEAVNLAVETEERLASLGVPKADRSGATITRSSAGPSANSYKYSAAGTSFTLRRNSKGDYELVEVKRITVYPRQAERTHLTVSEKARNAIVRHALDGISVHAPAAIAA